MKRGLHLARTICCFLVISVCYLLMLQSAQRLERCERFALVVLEDGPLRAPRVRQMRQLEAEQKIPADFAAWGQTRDVTAENRDLQRSARVSVVALSGRSDIVLPGTAWLDEGDSDGCLIDEDTAMELFGSVNVVGMTVTVGKSRKTIRGFLRGVSGTVLMEADDSRDLTCLTVSMGAGMAYENLQQTFLARHGLQGSFLRLDILSQAAQLLCLLVPLLAGCHMLAVCAGQLWACRRTGGAAAAGMIACAALLLAFLASHIHIPADMIPTKWSDFSFWGEWWRRRRESLLFLLLTEKQKPMQPSLDDFYRVCAWFLPAFFACMFFPRGEMPDGSRSAG